MAVDRIKLVERMTASGRLSSHAMTTGKRNQARAILQRRFPGIAISTSTRQATMVGELIADIHNAKAGRAG